MTALGFHPWRVGNADGGLEPVGTTPPFVEIARTDRPKSTASFAAPPRFKLSIPKCHITAQKGR